MKTYVLCDPRNDFISDVNTSMLLESYPYQVISAPSIMAGIQQCRSHEGAVLVVSDITLSAEEGIKLPNGTLGYATTPEGEAALTGVASLGLCTTSESLLTKLMNPTAIPASASQSASSRATGANSKPAAPAKPTPVAESKSAVPKAPAAAPQQPVAPVEAPQPAATPVQPVAQPTAQPVAQPVVQPTVQPAQPQMPQLTPEMLAALMQLMQQQQPVNTEPVVPVAAPTPAVVPEPAPVPQVEVAPQEEPEEVTPVVEAEPAKKENKAKNKDSAKEMRKRKRMQETAEADAAIDEDIYARQVREKQKTKVVSVYAAKGGVGKTTIAKELAVYLALTSNGRRKLRVCICDYNIDFGDVSTTLYLPADAVTMSYWAAEIRERLGRGEAADDITYTRSEMEENYLQFRKDIGLYILAAPYAHEDSMLIKQDELRIMLDNLIKNGEFDYIICDTGNNTRDSSIIAIDNADFILLVATQDVTTANCNASVLRTLSESGFDTNKVRLVVNNAMPSRETKVSVQEVEEAFDSYKTVCVINRTTDIIGANNTGVPLVFKPNHNFTAQIAKIVRFIVGGDVPQPPKRGLFGFKKR